MSGKSTGSVSLQSCWAAKASGRKKGAAVGAVVGAVVGGLLTYNPWWGAAGGAFLGGLAGGELFGEMANVDCKEHNRLLVLGGKGLNLDNLDK